MQVSTIAKQIGVELARDSISTPILECVSKIMLESDRARSQLQVCIKHALTTPNPTPKPYPNPNLSTKPGAT